MNGAPRPVRDHPVLAARRVVRNTAFLALADVANKLMMFVFYIVAARHLGVAAFGALSFALAFVTMLSVITDLGLGALTVREVARDHRVAGDLIGNALGVKVLASGIAIVLICLLINLMGYPWTTVRVVYICSILVVEGAITAYFCFVFQGVERMEFSALSRIVQSAVLVVGAVLLSRSGAIVERYAFLYGGAGFLSALVAGTIASRIVRFRLSFAPRQWAALLRRSLPMGLAAMFTMFYYWNGSTLLSKLRGNEAVGDYSAAFRLIMGVAFIGFAFSGAIFPLLSRLFIGSQDRLARTLETAVRYMVILALPLAVFGTIFARPLVVLLYGNDYSGAVSVFRILSWWGACACANSLLSNYFVSANLPGAVTIQTCLALGTNVILNFVLIPVLGAVGAATSIVAAEGLSLVFLAVRQRLTPARVRLRHILSTLLRVGVALFIGGAVALVAIRWHLFAGLAAGISLYVLVLVAVREIGRGDRTLLRSLLKARDG